MKKKYISFIIFFIIVIHNAFSQMTAFACFQNHNAPENAKYITKIFEDKLFDLFFDHGFIVTSLPMIKINSKEEISIENIKLFFEQAADYLIIFYFEYGSELIYNKGTNSKEPDWKTLSVFVVNFENEKQLYRTTININSIKKLNTEKKAALLADKISQEVLTKLNIKP